MSSTEDFRTRNRRLLCALALTISMLPFLSLVVSAQSGNWSPKAPMPGPRSALVAGVIGGKLYVAGGTDINGASDKLEIYDPSTNAWTTKSPMPTRRSIASAAVVDGIFYVIGGNEGAGTSAKATVLAYDPSSDTWAFKQPMPTARILPAAVVVDGIIHVVGGNLSGFVLAPTGIVEAYDPKSDTWTARAPMPTARYGLAAGVIDGVVYAVGGTDVSGFATAKVESFNPLTNTWSSRTPMSTSRSGLSASVESGILYAMAGTNNSGPPTTWPLATAEAYDPRANNWESVPPMPTGRVSLSSGVIEGVIYAVGGYRVLQDTTNVPLAVNEAFTPFLPVTIDIKPGDPHNTINLKSNANVTVAILGSAALGAANVDPASVAFAGASVAAKGNGAPKYSFSDVNHDGFIDLLVDFRAGDLQLAATDTQAVLKATTFEGQRIRGVDAVRILH